MIRTQPLSILELFLLYQVVINGLFESELAGNKNPFGVCLPISMQFNAEFFIEGLVNTIIERIFPIIPKVPMGTRTGPYINHL